jgi:argininosuccinate lyase
MSRSVTANRFLSTGGIGTTLRDQSRRRCACAAGIVTLGEQQKIKKGLRAIEQDRVGKFEVGQVARDVHEHRSGAYSRWGRGAKLRTARNRNDQNTLDLRVYVKRRSEIAGRLCLQTSMLNSEQRVDVVMPGAHARARPANFLGALFAGANRSVRA